MTQHEKDQEASGLSYRVDRYNFADGAAYGRKDERKVIAKRLLAVIEEMYEMDRNHFAMHLFKNVSCMLAELESE